jgi:hypothetical protein
MRPPEIGAGGAIDPAPGIGHQPLNLAQDTCTECSKCTNDTCTGTGQCAPGSGIVANQYEARGFSGDAVAQLKQQLHATISRERVH